MNIQSSPAQTKNNKPAKAAAIRSAAIVAGANFPADAEVPIRSHFLDDDRLRALGESLGAGDLSDLTTLKPFDFQARIRENAKKIAGFIHGPEDSPGRTASPDCGGDGAGRDFLGGRIAHFRVFQARHHEPTPVEMAFAVLWRGGCGKTLTVLVCRETF